MARSILTYCRRAAGAAGLLLALIIALAASGCSSISGTGQLLLPELPQAASSVRREHERVLAAYGGAYENARLQAKIASVVERLVAASARPEMTYEVTILNSPAVNAFALPTGQLYVTRGLLGLASDSAELASVLSHEMAHVIARHAAIREAELRRTDLIGNVNAILGDPQVGALALARSRLALASFTQAQEFEADGAGIGIAARSGYDPFGAARLLAAMGRNAELRAAGRRDGRPGEFLSSHPATPERIKNAQTIARQYGAAPPGERDKASYLESVDGLLYGEDPVDGFVRGRRYVHPRLGFAFTAPQGFALDDTARAVLGFNDSAAQAMRLDVVRIAPEQSLVDYLNNGAIENIDPGSVQELSVNTFPAATATAQSDQWAFRLYAIRFGSDLYRFIFAAKKRTVETERTFRESVHTLRRLSDAEIQSAKPLRLAVVKIAPGDSVEQLAARMAPVERPLDRFRVLNGLDANERPKPGDLVKIIVQ